MHRHLRLEGQRLGQGRGAEGALPRGAFPEYNGGREVQFHSDLLAVGPGRSPTTPVVTCCTVNQFVPASLLLNSVVPRVSVNVDAVGQSSVKV